MWYLIKLNFISPYNVKSLYTTSYGYNVHFMQRIVSTITAVVTKLDVNYNTTEVNCLDAFLKVAIKEYRIKMIRFIRNCHVFVQDGQISMFL